MDSIAIQQVIKDIDLSVNDVTSQQVVSVMQTMPILQISLNLYSDQPSILRINEHTLKRSGLRKLTDEEMFK